MLSCVESLEPALESLVPHNLAYRQYGGAASSEPISGTNGLNCFSGADSLMLDPSPGLLYPNCESACSNRGDGSPQAAGALCSGASLAIAHPHSTYSLALLAHAGSAFLAVGL